MDCFSRPMTLLPRTVIYTGTPGGVGITRKPTLFRMPGGFCEADSEEIGVLHNRLLAEKKVGRAQ